MAVHAQGDEAEAVYVVAADNARVRRLAQEALGAMPGRSPARDPVLEPGV
jgi:hypothetical protein